MTVDSVEAVAAAVLYEGFMLYPYRRSAVKNQQRWTFGGVYPPRFAERSSGEESCRMQTQCLLTGNGQSRVDVKVRFLHIVNRRVARSEDDGLVFVDELRVGAESYRPWEEAVEREFLMTGTLDSFLGNGRQTVLDVPGGSETEPLLDGDTHVTGALVRDWRPLSGRVDVAVESVEGAYKLTVGITNTTEWTEGGPVSDAGVRREAIWQTFVSTHTILRVRGGAFISLLEPPPAFEAEMAACTNIKTWPVLAGTPGDTDTMLSSPIILYDYPQIAPETPGDLFDATEIDELLRLSIMTLTDEEKQEMRESDPRTREILERTESLAPDELMNLHAAVRTLQTRHSEGP